MFVELLNINVVGTGVAGATADTVTFAGGAGGSGSGAGTNGDSIKIGTNGKIVLTSSLAADAVVHNNVDLGTVKGTNAEIDGSASKARSPQRLLTATPSSRAVRLTTR